MPGIAIRNWLLRYAFVMAPVSGARAPLLKIRLEPAAAAGGEAASGPMSGEQVYQTHCVACHGTGAAGAPKIGDAAAWKPRIAKGIDALLTSATNGLNAMPPKGLCMSCSQDELKGAIEYMISKSQ